MRTMARFLRLYDMCDQSTRRGDAECLPAKRDIAVRPPRIVSTFPPQGRTVRPGLAVVRITFDRPMTCDGALHNDETLMPACSDGRQDLILSFDRLALRTVCVAPPNGRFGRWLNGPAADIERRWTQPPGSSAWRAGPCGHSS